LTLLDGLSPRERVVVIAATNLPDALDPALRRPGRFEREIAFLPPGPEGRTEILSLHLSRAPVAPAVDLPGLAARCHGFVGADLAALAREAGLAALARARSAAGGVARLEPEALQIEQDDLEAARRRIRPSALRSDGQDGRPPKWSDIGGLDAAKGQLTEAVIWPITRAEALARLRLTAPRGILLAGPPGTGKTLLVRALASEAGMNFLPMRPAALLSQFLGEAERALADAFGRARHAAPALLFFDEIDTLAPARGRADATVDRIVAELLTQMDGLEENAGVTVIAATNRPEALDAALTRPGRFDLVVPVGLPDAGGRLDVLNVHARGRPLAPEVDLDGLARATEGASPADLAALMRQAARAALSRWQPRTRDAAGSGALPQILPADIEAALAALRERALALRPSQARPPDSRPPGTREPKSPPSEARPPDAGVADTRPAEPGDAP
jgi:transitional endoplasmic reticulum ATPase